MSATAPSAAAPLHGAVDSIIRRQQGRLLNLLRNRGTLDRETESAICTSYTWAGQDIHTAIDGASKEAENAQAAKQ
jgi:hypothetical protein